ncbi:pilus assembly protein [Arenimonas sp.]|uniref:pilus assembly protein n=1 Tax=Arenimonas sp. TaxID=1872635 RepID=UPI002E3562DD|nr:PilC/PilY family type IV pilus protein [Arenimonas sp.]HEX4853015.1 PilC/PilY family type IV pilus protein [Arenimonas sp.]
MSHLNSRTASANHRLLAMAIGAAVAIASLPVQAALIVPNVPLQSGDAVAPNVWFILDDSGSMEGTQMDDPSLAAVSGTGVNISSRTYVSNTIYYNPAKEYDPWQEFDGSFFPETPYTAAWGDASLASTPVNLALNNQIFYVPKADATDLTDPRQYYLWYFPTGGVSALRCERLYNAGTDSWFWGNCTNITSFTWTRPDGTTVTRDLDEELENYATWYSYHRTRMKVAKAGTSYAFNDLGDDVRVGFTTIWDRNKLDIPVATDNGRFRNLGASTNRSTWFARLFAAEGEGTTPLIPALSRAGDMYDDTGASSPWGPETGTAQLACRQNFTILTTDGFWNEGSTSIGNSDNTAGSTIANPQGGNYTYEPAAPFKDAYSNTLADVAMQYWKTDLRTDLENIVPTTSSNPAFWQHMVTFGISIGLRGSLDPVKDMPGLIAGTTAWPDPMDNEDIERIDDLLHASVNGHGSFVAASDPEQFTIGLRNALNAIVERTASGSNVAANTVRLDSETRIFQASYIAGKWTGELASYPISSAGVSATPDWLGSLGIPATGRKVFTLYGSTKATFPTTEQSTAMGANQAAYVAGSTANEISNGGTFRNRAHLLGDIINSSPAFVRETNTIFVGANDGMLHAFATTGTNKGKELFAFVPNATSAASLAKLKTLADPNYSHQYFVDGPVVVSSYADTPNKNYLVGTLGRGGKGVYFLDVTSPTTFAATNITTEYPGSTTDADMGFVLGRPLIANVLIGTSLTNAVKTPVAIVSNGINSTNGDPVLFVFNLATGEFIKKIVAQAVATDDDNGLSAPRGWDEDGDRLLDYVYAGDLKGNIWKFDFTSPKVVDWGLHVEGDPFFVATDSAGKRQPITGGLSVSLNPTDFKPWVFFGTGKYIESTDLTSPDVQTLYGVKDLNAAVGARADNLQARTLVATGVIDNQPVRAFEANAPLDQAKKGWYVDLPAPKTTPPTPAERIVGDPFLLGTTLVVPSIVPSSNPCGGGTGFINAIDAFSGTSVSSPFFDVDGDGSFDDDTLKNGNANIPVGSVNLGIAMPTSPTVVENLLVAGGSLGTTGTVAVNNPLFKGRISWREIVRD